MCQIAEDIWRRGQLPNLAPGPDKSFSSSLPCRDVCSPFCLGLGCRVSGIWQGALPVPQLTGWG